MALEINDILAGTLSANTFSASTIYSAGTNVEFIFAPNVPGGYLAISGGTVTGATSFVSNLSASTIFSANTNLNSIFHPLGSISSFAAGTNTYTGGTFFNQTVNVSALTINTLIASGATQLGITTATSLSGSTVSGGTLFSAATNLNSIFQPIGSVSANSNGTNTYTGGTYFNTTINVSALTINTIVASGSSQLAVVTATSLSGGTVSGGTLFSGSTNLNSIFHPLGSVSPVVGGTNTYTGGTFLNPTVNVSALTINTLVASGATQLAVVTSTSLSGGTVSGGTIFSGATNLNSIFHPLGSVSPVAAGTNTYTGGTFLNPTVNVSALTVNTIVASGATQLGTTTATSLSGGTVSGGTIFSGSTNLNSIFQPLGANSVVVNGTNTYTGGTFLNPTVNVSALTINTIIASGSSQLAAVTATSLSGGTLSGGTITSGSTSLYNIFTPSGFSKIDFQVIASGDTSTITTSSTSFVDIPGMSASSRNFGTSATTYRVDFNCDVANSNNNSIIFVKLQKNGVDLSGTTRNVSMATANQRLSISTIGFTTSVANGDVLKAQWRVSAGTGTMTGRTFSILGTATNNVI